MYKGYDYENPFQIKVTCPFCNKPTKKEQLSLSSTLVYQPLIYDENGRLVPPENSSNSSRYTWKCLECGNTFVTDDGGNILSKNSSTSVNVSFGLQTSDQQLYLSTNRDDLNIKC
jgi:ribosomal protein L37AE/L43A